MGKTLKYVQDFDFKAKPCNYAMGGGVFDGTSSALRDKVKQARSVDAMKKVRRDIDRNEMPRRQSAKIDQSGPKIQPPPPAGPNAPLIQPTPPNAALNKLASVGNPAIAAARPFKKGGVAKVGKVMGEFKSGKLHSGSKKGPVVTSKKQAVAIALSEAKKSKNRA